VSGRDALGDTPLVLRVAYSNKPEALVAQLEAALAAEVGLPPRDLFTPTRLIVGSRPLEAWVKRQLAPRAGIVANLETWLLRRFTATLAERAFPGRRLLDETIISDLLLQQFLAQRALTGELAPVSHYLGEGSGRELRAAQLATQLGHLFEEYLFSRATMLADWAAGRPSPLDGGEALAAWQRRLWHGLVTGPARRFSLPTELLDAPADTLIAPGTPLFVFGLSFLGTTYHRLLEHLARAADVHLFVLNPCMEFWEDVESVRDRARFARRDEKLSAAALAQEDPFALKSDECRPLALWGRPGREAVRLFNQATQGKVEGVFVDPTQAAEVNLLRHLQRDMLHRRPTLAVTEPLAGVHLDGIEFVQAPSVRRECEFVAGRIWALLSEPGSTLRLDDIAVLIAARDAERYVPPLLGALRENHELPWQLVGLPFAVTSPVVEAALLLLELPLSRFSRADVMRALTHPLVGGRFAGEDLDAWARWVDALGIVHGLDHAAHEGTYIDRDVLNWDQGLKRLALGAFLASGEGTAAAFVAGDEQYYPEPAGRHLDDGAGALLLLARSLLADAARLRDLELPVREWAARLDTFLSSYLSPRDDFERRALDAALRTVRSLAERDLGEQRVSYLLAKELIREELASAGASSGGAVTGGVRVSPLAASRGIPARVTFIVGLSEGAFPASDRTEALDLRSRRPQPGDASGREKDEYLFLEALLVTRDRLVLSWVARDERSGEARPPSAVVAELQRLLDEGVLGRKVDDPREHPLVRRVPLWRADADAADDTAVAPSAGAVLERQLRVVGTSLLAAAPAREPEAPVRALLDLLPETPRRVLERATHRLAPPAHATEAEPTVRRVTLSQLRQFLECPLQGAARVRLRLGDDDDDDLRERTDERFGAPALVAVPLLRAAIVDAWRAAGGRQAPTEAAVHAAFERRASVLVAQGVLPVGVFLDAERESARAVLAAWREAVARLPGALEVVRFGGAEEHEQVERVEPPLSFEVARGERRARVEVVGATQPLVDRSASVVFLRKSKPSTPTKELLRPWLDQLALAAAGLREGAAHRAVLACADDVVDEPLPPVTQAEARAWFEQTLGALLFDSHEYLLPLEALIKAEESGPASIHQLVEAELGNERSTACQGPLRRAHAFRLPTAAEYQAARARLRPLLECGVAPPASTEAPPPSDPTPKRRTARKGGRA
jgi:exodeoxyribonuclease V gamma subunit